MTQTQDATLYGLVKRYDSLVTHAVDLDARCAETRTTANGCHAVIESRRDDLPMIVEHADITVRALRTTHERLLERGKKKMFWRYHIEDYLEPTELAAMNSTVSTLGTFDTPNVWTQNDLLPDVVANGVAFTLNQAVYVRQSPNGYYAGLVGATSLAAFNGLSAGAMVYAGYLDTMAHRMSGLTSGLIAAGTIAFLGAASVGLVSMVLTGDSKMNPHLRLADLFEKRSAELQEYFKK